MDIEELKVNAESGDVDVQYELAQKYYSGDGVDKNIEKAIYFYEKAAEQGDSSSMYALALHYCGIWKSNDDSSSADKAKHWGEKAQNNGHAIGKCLNDLGVYYP